MKDPDKKKKKSERGIETMLRIVAGNHQRLSDMADNKAHIMITVNSIILSVVLGVLLRKIEEYSNLAFPAILLLIVNVGTIIFAALATRPSIPFIRNTKQEVNPKKLNLLFFGNFYQMEMEEYISSMQIMMQDGDYLYRSMLKDIYSQGAVLSRKYHLLRLAYNTFMFGIVASVMAFVISILWAGEML